MPSWQNRPLFVCINGGKVMTQREAIRERRRKRKQQQRMVTIMIIAGIALISVAFIMVPTILRNVQTVGEFIEPELNQRPMAIDNAMGDPNAPVVIEEFSDFGCNHCADFAFGTGEQIAENYVANGQVYFISRSVGNLLNNPNTQLAAEATYCAADQGKYWEYHDIVYSNQSTLFYGGVTYIDNYLNAFAETLGLNTNAFEDCLNDGKYSERVMQDGLDAQSAGINSTPSFLINGTLVRGNIPYPEFQAYIEGALETVSNQ
jgi:protein-disulfide isomerase